MPPPPPRNLACREKIHATRAFSRWESLRLKLSKKKYRTTYPRIILIEKGCPTNFSAVLRVKRVTCEMKLKNSRFFAKTSNESCERAFFAGQREKSENVYASVCLFTFRFKAFPVLRIFLAGFGHYFLCETSFITGRSLRCSIYLTVSINQPFTALITIDLQTFIRTLSHQYSNDN